MARYIIKGGKKAFHAPLFIQLPQSTEIMAIWQHVFIVYPHIMASLCCWCLIHKTHFIWMFWIRMIITLLLALKNRIVLRKLLLIIYTTPAEKSKKNNIFYLYPYLILFHKMLTWSLQNSRQAPFLLIAVVVYSRKHTASATENFPIDKKSSSNVF